MANQYTAKVTATLVRGSLQQAIDKEAKGASLKLSNITIDAKSLSSAIQNELKNVKINIDSKGVQSSGQQITKTLNTVQTSTKKTSAETQKLNQELTKLRSSTLSNNIQTWMNKNAEAGKKFEQELRRIQTQMKGNMSADSLKLASAQFQNIQSQAKAAGLTVSNFRQSFVNLGSATKNFVLQMVGLGSAYQIGMKAISTIKNGISTVVDLDTALVDLRKTTSMSGNQLTQFYRDANTEAKNLGVTTKEIIEQAAAWSRLGYSTAEQVKTMSRLSSQFAQISPGMSVKEAQESLVSTMKAFGFETDQVLDGIMSKINILGNSFALSNKDLADALQVSSSSMSAANNSFEQTLALITAGTEITQDASRVGNGLRTISMRIRGLNEETGEFDEELGNVKNDISELTHGLVSVMEDENTYRSTYEILQRISEIWDQLTDKEQAGLLEKLFGKNRAQIGAAILSNFEAAQEAMVKMEHSAGNADREMSIIMDSLEYKLNRLKETGTGIWQNLLDRGEVGHIVDGLTKILSVIDKITGALGGLGTILAGGAIATAIAFFTSPSAMLNITTAFLGIGSLVSTLAPFLAIGGALYAAIKAYQQLHPTLEAVTSDLNDIKQKSDDLSVTYGENLQRIAELQDLKRKGSITASEDAELVKLQAQNEAIQAQIELYKNLYDAKKQEQLETARREARDLLDSSNDPGTWGVQDTIDFYNNAKQQLKSATPGSWASKQYSKQVELYGNRLSDEIDSISQIIELLDAEKDSALIAELTSLMDTISESINGDTNKYIREFENNLKSLSDDTLQKLINGEELTVEEAKNLQHWMYDNRYTAEDLAEYIDGLSESMEHSAEASASMSESVIQNIGNLTSLQDELAVTSQALADYNAAMEGGEKGDAIGSIEEIYKGAMEDIAAGKLDTNRLHAAASLLFSPEQLASMNYDMQEVAKQLQSTFMKSLFDASSTDMSAGQRMIQQIMGNADMFKGIAEVTKNADGSMSFFYDSLSKLADAFGISEAAMAAFLDEFDAYGVEVMRSTEENNQLIAQYQQIEQVAGSTKEAVAQFITALREAGRDDVEISSILSDLSSAGVIAASVSELNGQIAETANNLQDVDNSDANPEVKVKDNATSTISYIKQQLASIPRSVTTTVNTNYTESGVKTSFSGSYGTGSSSASSKVSSKPTSNKPTRAAGGRGTGTDTLVNELGPELISDNGVAFIANGGKPGFTYLSKDAVVFNADETKRIFGGSSSNIPSPAFAGGTSGSIRDRLINGLNIPAKALSFSGSYTKSGSSTTKTVTVSVKKCPRCGSSVAQGVQLCPYCGYNFVTGGYTTSGTKTYTTNTGSTKSNPTTTSVVQWSSPLADAISASGTPIGFSGNYTKTSSGTIINGPTSSKASPAGTYTAPQTIKYPSVVTSGSGSGYGGGGSDSYGGSDIGGYTGSSDSVGSSNWQSQSDPEKVDWIAVAINRIQRAIADLQKVATSGFKKLSTRLTASRAEIQEVTHEIDIMNQGYERYLQEANKVGLSEDLAEKVRNGTIDINAYNESTRKLISEYQEW